MSEINTRSVFNEIKRKQAPKIGDLDIRKYKME